MTKWLQKVKTDILRGRNLEHYITLLFILIIFALDVFNLASTDILTEITLAVLGLMVFTSLSTQNGLDQIQKMLDKPYSADQFFWVEKRSLESDIKQANNIWFVGATLSRTVRDYSAVLEQRLKHGAEVKFIVIDPHSSAPEQAMQRSKGVQSKQFYVDLLRPTLERISALSYTSDKISLGLLPYKPAFGMFMLDPDDPRGRIIVEMYPHRSTDLFPTFELTPSRDAYGYKYFRDQFEILWNSCEKRTWQGEQIQEFVKIVRENAR